MKGRKPILVVSLITGALALLGAGLFAVAGAMIYGSFARVIYSDATLLLVLLCGPVSVLVHAIELLEATVELFFAVWR